MTFTKRKYEGTTEYFLVFAELLRAVQTGTTITYGDVAPILGLPPAGHHMAAETGHILGEISFDEVRRKRPMLSAVAVSTKGMPGRGFFVLARELGVLTAQGRRAEHAFWLAQITALQNVWRVPSPRAMAARKPSRVP